MAKKKLLWGAAMAVFLVSCGAPKVLTTPKTEATNFEATGNYSQALTAWTSYFETTAIEEVAGADFAQAAKTAFKAGNAAQAISWFDQARYKNYADADMYQTLAAIYQQQDNLSKELSALEYITENYGSDNNEVNARLLAIYTEIDANDKALEVWSKMDSASKNKEENLNHYFEVNKALENEAVCDSLADALLGKNPEHLEALEWNAKKYYWAGQNRYEREMAKYNANKTRKNYNTLLKELDLVTADFKKALPYLNKLWKLNPGKEYAGYLVNIYARFGNEDKTKFYQNYMK
jgi:tetratricopeptide (TPR) repeat protein